MAEEAQRPARRGGLIRRILKKESSGESPPCSAATATTGGQARDSPPSCSQDPPPSVVWAFVSLFTMGFARHNLKVAKVHGSSELGSRLREEYTNLGILAAFTGAIVFSELFTLPSLLKESEWEWLNNVKWFKDAAVIVTMLGFVLIMDGLLLSMANLMVLDTMPDTLLAVYQSRVICPARLPYICLVAGVILWCMATTLTAPFIFAPALSLALMIEVWVAVMIVTVACVQLIYVADGLYHKGGHLRAGATDDSEPTSN